VERVEENDRTDIEGAVRMARGERRRVVEEARALGDIVGPAFVLPNRRRLCGEGVGVEDGLMRVKARAKVRGAAMAVGRGRSDIGGGRRKRRTRKRRRRRRRR
jgi:hypothetical protein